MENLSQVINLHPTHYLADYWIQNADPYIGQLPTMAPGIPVGWGILVLTIGFIARFLGPWWMSNKQPFDCKPWMLCVNGFFYGWYAVGMLTVAVPSHMYTDCFKCSAYSRSTLTLESFVIKHFAYGIVFAKLLDLIIFPSFKFLSKQQDRMSDLHLLYLMSLSMGSVCLVKLQPGGIFIFCAIMDGVSQVVVYSYLTFAAASEYFRPSKTWKMAILFSKMVTWTLTLAHSVYFLAIPNCGDPVIKLALAAFSASVLVLFPYDFYRLDALAQEKRRIALMKRASLIEKNNNNGNSKKTSINNNLNSDELSMIRARFHSKDLTASA